MGFEELFEDDKQDIQIKEGLSLIYDKHKDWFDNQELKKPINYINETPSPDDKIKKSITFKDGLTEDIKQEIVTLYHTVYDAQ